MQYNFNENKLIQNGVYIKGKGNEDFYEPKKIYEGEYLNGKINGYGKDMIPMDI